MLAEIRDARQVPGEGFRRWFTDDYFDLIVWYDAPGLEPPPDPVAGVKGFQLCYDKTGRERALTWTREHGFQHNRIDAGEIPGHAKMTPVILADGEFSHDAIAEKFRAQAAAVDPALARFVYAAVKGYPRRPVR
jgi:hypothetical protein